MAKVPETRTCRCCGRKIPSDKAIQHKKYPTYYFCSLKCEQDGLSVLDKLMIFLSEIYNKPKINYSVLSKQVMEYTMAEDIYGERLYKDTGILLTVKYCLKVLGMAYVSDIGIAFMPYYYEEAKGHYERLARNKKIAQKFTEDNVVYIKPNNNVDTSLLKYRYDLERREDD